MFVLGIFYFA